MMKTRPPIAIIFLISAIGLGALFCNFPRPPALTTSLTPSPTETVPILVSTLISPTPSPIPTLPPTTTSLPEEIFTDGENDAISCQTGVGLGALLPPEVDIGAVWVQPSGDDLTFSLRFDRASDLLTQVRSGDTDFLGGVELYDPSESLPDIESNWYFNHTGNLSFNFGWNKDLQRLVAWKTFSTDGNNWQVVDDVFYPTEIQGNILQLTIPSAQIPANGRWMAVATNFAVCDEIGLEDGLPALLLP